MKLNRSYGEMALKARLSVVMGIMLAVCGCTLEAPQECMSDWVKCVNSKDAGMVYTCTEDGKWSAPEVCPGGAFCKDDQSCGDPECTLGQRLCTASDKYGGSIRICTEELRWGDPVPCDENAGCLDETTCALPDLCVENETRCQDTPTGGILVKCDSEGHWTENSPCQDNLGCRDSRNCIPPERCEPNTTKCTDTETSGMRLSCNADGHWENLGPCKGSFMCKDEFECDSCIDGNTKCSETEIGSVIFGNIATCEDGVWSASVTCPGNARCKDREECDEPPQEDKCASEKKACTNTVINGIEYGQYLSCEENVTQIVSCPDNASCKDEENCGDCTNGSTKCEGGQIFLCKNGTFVFSTDCETGQCSDKTQCEKCETTCEDNSSSVGVITKKCDGKDPVTTECNKVSCDGTQCGECLNTSKDGPGSKCENNADETGAVFKCVLGKKENYQICSKNNSCSYQGYYYCGECHNGSISCQDIDGIPYLQRCDGGAWGGPTKQKIACPNDDACNSDGTFCDGEYISVCGEYTYGDHVGVVYYKDGTQKKCNNVSCNSDRTDCGVCLISSKGPSVSCTNDSNGVGHLKGCVSGELIDEVCPFNVPCLSDFACSNCPEGSSKCELKNNVGELKVCRNGVWETYTCSKKVGCNADNTFCDIDSNSICVTRIDSKDGYTASMKDNKVEIKQCSNKSSCRSTGVCGNCNQSMLPYCEGGEMFSCPGGVLKRLPCASGYCQDENECQF